MQSKIIKVLFILAVLMSCESINKAFSAMGQSNRQGDGGQVQGSQLLVTADQSDPDDSRSTEAIDPNWKKKIIDTTVKADYLTDTERQVIVEINRVRTDPAEYARRHLVPIRQYYNNTLLQYPGEIAISTTEGVRALDECIRDLRASKPLPPLSPKKGLTLAARDHAKDQAQTGATGHTGSDRSTVETRLNRYGRWDTSAGENIDYGNAEVRRIVSSVLIDDGVSSRGHRRNLLDRTFRFIGVAVGPHKVFRFMCVMDFAGSYK